MRKNRPLAGAAFAAALAAGCGRAPKAPVAPDNPVTLDAPAPSSMTVVSPLDGAATGYTNEMQAENLRDQSAQLGIRRLSRPTFRSPNMASDENDGAPRRTITYQEGVERTREMAADAEAQRHAIDGDKNKSVAIPSDTAGVLPAKKEGAPIENASGDQ